MNLLENIFLEFFSNRYYYNSTGRAYIEYICEEDKGFLGKICFFHFSILNNYNNGFNDIEILKFIKLFYSNSYIELYPILKYSINNNIIVTVNSLNEYEFIIKFWNENLYIRKFISYIIKKNTGLDFNISNNKNINFFELHIFCKNTFIIKNIKVYKNYNYINKENNNIYFGFLYESNISIIFKVDKWNFEDNMKHSKSILIKLDKPIQFIKSDYLLKKYFYKFLSTKFKKEEIFVGFIEKSNLGDTIYFTDGYSIRDGFIS